MFFFFKQKTAYEMRISDWSSDVCSSDLRRRTGRSDDDRGQGGRIPDPAARPEGARGGHPPDHGDAAPLGRRHHRRDQGESADADQLPRHLEARFAHHPRSEEQTSELQSLMRISYAGFCFKKKINNKKRIS